MARPLRVEFEGALYHLTGRGNARQRIFADDKDGAKFVQLLSESLQRYDVALHGYVLMGNHYHLIAENRRANLGRWMHWLTTAGMSRLFPCRAIRLMAQFVCGRGGRNERSSVPGVLT